MQVFLLSYKTDWSKIQGFITSGLIFRTIYSLSSEGAIVYSDDEREDLSAKSDKAIFDLSFYTNIGCQKRLNEKLSLFLTTSFNLDLYNGKKEKGFFQSGKIIHPAVSIGLGYDL